jgi:hypothetical protein
MKHPTLGPGVEIDVARLLVSRLLLQANSGGGKSWSLRRLLEQTHGTCQQIVVDVEGEFHTLRERYDFVLAGKGGDCPADLRGAELLARRLLELNVSAIVDISELGAQRATFVARFLSALMSAPRELWHPAMIVLDEAHLFAPEKGRGEAESTAAVIDLMTRGRKRGFCGVLATQRISKLHKDAAAEANNKLIGRCALDVDMRRAAEELGFTTREEQMRLRKLGAGHFFAFGPAIAAEVVEVQVGAVQTSHPEAGAKAPPPTPPRERIRKVLGELADLPAEAEAEARTSTELRAKVRQLESELGAAKHAVPKAETKVVEKPVIKAEQLARIEKMIHRVEAACGDLDEAAQDVETIRAQLGQDLNQLRAVAAIAKQPAAPAIASTVRPAVRAALIERKAAVLAAAGVELSGPERRVLEAIAWMRSLSIEQPSVEAVAFLAGYTPGGGAFGNVRGALRTRGLVHYPSPGLITLTPAGIETAPPVDPMTGPGLRDAVRARLANTERRVLEPLIAAYPASLSAEDLAAASGYGAGGGAFGNVRGRLRTLGLATYPSPGLVRAADLLFPEGT